MADPLDIAKELKSGADSASTQVRNLYITFLLAGVYAAVVVGSTTDLQLFLVAPVRLPILDVGLPIVGFYALVPWLILLLHVNLMLQLLLLAQRLHRLDGALGLVEDPEARERLRLTLFGFPFNHMLIGSRHSRLLDWMFQLIVWFSLIILPLLMLLWVQIRFLPYHDLAITWLQRLAILLDLIMLWLIWPRLMTPPGEPIAWYGKLRPDRMARGIADKWRAHGGRQAGRWEGQGTLLATTAIAAGLSLAVATVPGEASERALAGLLGTVPVPASAGRPSAPWLTRTLFDNPGAPFHRNLVLREQLLSAEPAPRDVVDRLYGTGGPEVWREAMKRVVGLDLSRRDLRFADLRGVALINADLRGADLSGSDLRQARLYNVDLRPADVSGGGRCPSSSMDLNALSWDVWSRGEMVKPQGDHSRFCLTKLDGANLRGAVLFDSEMLLLQARQADFRETQMWWIDLAGATIANSSFANLAADSLVFEHASLSEVSFHDASFKSAIFRNSTIEGADFGSASWGDKTWFNSAKISDVSFAGAKLVEPSFSAAEIANSSFEGADMADASFTSAVVKNLDFRKTELAKGDFTDARFVDMRSFQGADLTDARMPSLDLSGADFKDANLTRTDLTDAVLVGALFDRTTMEDTKLAGADLRFALFDDTRLIGVRLDGADLRGADLTRVLVRASSLVGADLRAVAGEGGYYQLANMRRAKIAGASLSKEPEHLNIAQVDPTPLTEEEQDALSELAAQWIEDERRLKLAYERLEAAAAKRQRPSRVFGVRTEDLERFDADARKPRYYLDHMEANLPHGCKSPSSAAVLIDLLPTYSRFQLENKDYMTRHFLVTDLGDFSMRYQAQGYIVEPLAHLESKIEAARVLLSLDCEPIAAYHQELEARLALWNEVRALLLEVWQEGKIVEGCLLNRTPYQFATLAPDLTLYLCTEAADTSLAAWPADRLRP
ncbi:MAG: pentapeptide repeat-containing protein [Pseudomonadota bacterium]